MKVTTNHLDKLSSLFFGGKLTASKITNVKNLIADNKQSVVGFWGNTNLKSEAQSFHHTINTHDLGRINALDATLGFVVSLGTTSFACLMNLTVTNTKKRKDTVVSNQFMLLFSIQNNYVHVRTYMLLPDMKCELLIPTVRIKCNPYLAHGISLVDFLSHLAALCRNESTISYTVDVNTYYKLLVDTKHVQPKASTAIKNDNFDLTLFIKNVFDDANIKNVNRQDSSFGLTKIANNKFDISLLVDIGFDNVPCMVRFTGIVDLVKPKTTLHVTHDIFPRMSINISTNSYDKNDRLLNVAHSIVNNIKALPLAVRNSFK